MKSHQILLTHPRRRTVSIILVLLGGALLFLAPEAGGWFGALIMLAGFVIEGLAVYRAQRARE